VDADESLRGQLLIASPALFDPNFRRAVLIVTEHSEEGAMGLVLNRPTEALVVDAVPPLEDIVEPGACVHVGGPVQPTAVVVLAEFGDADALTSSPGPCPSRPAARASSQATPAGARGSSKRSWSRSRGSSRLRSRTTSSPTTPTTSGAEYSGARAASMRSSPSCRRTPP